MTTVTGNQQQTRSGQAPTTDVLSGAASSRAGRGTANTEPPQRDAWTENVHMRTAADEEPQTVATLRGHRAALEACDKYIDYVHHVERANFSKYERNLEEIKLMNASGVTNSAQYQDTKFAIAEFEEELEQRDLTPFAKTTQSTNVNHAEVACIGTQTCAKQKLGPKLYPDALKQIAASQPAPTKPGEEPVYPAAAPEEALFSRSKAQEAADIMSKDQTCEDFVKLMDHISASRRSKRRDLHIRENFKPLSGKEYKSSTITDYKPQGGGIYSKATKSTTILRHSTTNAAASLTRSPMKNGNHTSMGVMQGAENAYTGLPKVYSTPQKPGSSGSIFNRQRAFNQSAQRT